MKLNLQNSNSSLEVGSRTKAAFYCKVYKASRKSEWMRCTGLGVSIVSASITVAMKASSCAELLTKGTINLCGAKCSRDCSAKRGAKQLFVRFPISIFEVLASPVSIGLGSLVTIGLILGNPIGYSYARFEHHSQYAQRLAYAR